MPRPSQPRTLREDTKALSAQTHHQQRRAATNLRASGSAPAQNETSARTAWIVVEQLLAIVEVSLRERANLQRALVSRLVLEQAKGILAERLSISPEMAFEVLRTAARSSRRRIHTVAREVIERPDTPRDVLAAVHAELLPQVRRRRPA